MEHDKVEAFHQQRVLVLLNGTTQLGKLCDIIGDTVHMEIATSTSEKTKITLALADIQKIVSKDHIRFIIPKIALSKESDAAMTRHIENIKKNHEFTLQTRRYQLQVNGSKQRLRWSSRDFEKKVAQWLTTKRPLEICPFALVKIGKEEFLLGIDRGHHIHKITKKENIILM